MRSGLRCGYIVWAAFVLPAVPASVLAQTDELRFYQELAWSPDGSRIAFSVMMVSRARWEREQYVALGGADYDIYVMNADGSELRRLTDNPRYDLWLSWSPDARRLVFGSERDGNTDLYVMDASGANVQRITREAGRESGPSWSPDGRSIAFMSKQNGHWQIWVMRADGSAARQLTTAAADHSNPIWSPDGRMLVYYGNPAGPGRDQVFLMNVDGPPAPRALDDGVFPAFAPDGRSVIYGQRGTLYTVGTDGMGRRLLAQKSEFGRYSPDGRRIAFVMGDFPDTGIYIMNADGTEVRRLTH
jgi:TolB protein